MELAMELSLSGRSCFRIWATFTEGRCRTIGTCGRVLVEEDGVCGCVCRAFAVCVDTTLIPPSHFGEFDRSRCNTPSTIVGCAWDDACRGG